MRPHRERNRRIFLLESLEWRNAPSSAGMAMVGAHHAGDLHQEHRGPQQVEIRENHRGRDVGQNRDRNDVVDNDPNDNDINDNDPNDNDVNDNDPNDNDVNDNDENHRGRDDGANQNRDSGGRGRH
jgi:hypothetical protein